MSSWLRFLNMIKKDLKISFLAPCPSFIYVVIYNVIMMPNRLLKHISWFYGIVYRRISYLAWAQKHVQVNIIILACLVFYTWLHLLVYLFQLWHIAGGKWLFKALLRAGDEHWTFRRALVQTANHLLYIYAPTGDFLSTGGWPFWMCWLL